MGRRNLPLWALLALGAGSLLFDLTLPLRLPSDEDWADAAAALRRSAQPGDAVQIWPVWAERARLFVDAAPVVAEEDPGSADYVGVRRLWLLSLPRTPFFSSPGPALISRGATAAPPMPLGALSLQAWDLHAPRIASELTSGGEQHEVDYVARACRQVPIGGRLVARGAAGRTLHLRAGIIGERAYDAGRPTVRVDAFADGVPVGTLDVPRTARDGTGWRRLDAPLPPGPEEREFAFTVSSADRAPPFCLQAWTTR